VEVTLKDQALIKKDQQIGLLERELRMYKEIVSQM